ncbi:nucleoprotein TPR [Fistulifera solaris]|uniref:Nucleoprotein TPR n=1 Tax=Fistulifera solaris TaxID=1519565 RepID=A0A1Z5KRW2_FISSO|nr:nucleoprotein TPR [Fistulifera solaris]|eukprot:GAX28927.1 nucleoprotein TPR [Fistulifera solaris]
MDSQQTLNESRCYSFLPYDIQAFRCGDDENVYMKKPAKFKGRLLGGFRFPYCTLGDNLPSVAKHKDNPIHLISYFRELNLLLQAQETLESMDTDFDDSAEAPFPRGDDLVSQTVLEDLERQYFAVREERDRLEHELLEVKENLVDDASETISQLRIELEKEVANKLVTQSKIQTLEESIKLAQERVDRSQAESDSLREELSRLSDQNAEKSKIISTLEVQTKLKDSEAIPLFLETQRLRIEIDSLQAHSKWLEKELQQKAEDYNRLQQESRDRTLDLHMQIDQTTTEKKTVEASLQIVKQTEVELQQKVDRLSRDLLSTKQELVAVQETSEDQLRAEKKLVQLQKDHLERWQQRYNDVVRQNEDMKEAAARAMEANEEELSSLRLELETEKQQLLERQKEDYEKKLEELQANPRYVGTIANSIEMAIDDEKDAEPMSLTDLYTKLEETKQALRQEKIQCKHWQLQFRQVEQDILDFRPKMIRQLEEYELAMDKMNDYEQRLRQVIFDRDTAREEARDAQNEISTMRLVLATKKKESEELAKQVQGLLTSRSGGNVDDDVPLSVQQMQSQNQRLLAEQQRLMLVIEDLERKIDNDDLQRKLEDQESELNILRQEQRDQESLAIQIAMQRDLYKSLLVSKDSNILGSFQDEADALAVLKRQSDRSRALEERNKELENQLVAAKSDYNSALREKESLSERIGRYESVLAELRSSVDSLESQLVLHRSEAARRSSETDYHKEKSERLESALERSRGEVRSIMNAKSELERMNADLQRSLSQVNSRLSRAEEDSRRMESNLRLLQAQVDTAKASEARAVEENHQLRADVARYGSVNDNLRRIEATLATKAGSEQEKLHEEVARFSSQLKLERDKHSGEVEKLQLQLSESDMRVKDLEHLSSKAQADLLKADKALLEVKAELNGLASKCKSLESQLEVTTKADAVLTGDDDVYASLQARIDSLALQIDLKDAELASMTEKITTYKNLSQASESELATLKALTEENTTKQVRELADLEEKVKSLSALNISKQEIIQDLTNDLAGYRDERSENETKLTTEIATLRATIESQSRDVEALEEANVTLKLDVESLRSEITIAQRNYERELRLHSQARSSLREVQEKLSKEEQTNTELRSSFLTLQRESEGHREAWAEEKSSLQEALEIKMQTLKHAREQNAALHTQLENLRNATQTNIVDTSLRDDGAEQLSHAQQKEVSELRELVRFLRSENELIQSELDNTKRSFDRERSASNVLKRNLDQARAELHVLLSESRDKGDQGNEAVQKIHDVEAQVMVLTDSNKVLRTEKERLQKENLDLQQEIEVVKESSKPNEAVICELRAQVAALDAERDGLKRDLGAWKERVQNLVSKFNQIDPEEHSRLKETIRAMEEEKESLNAWKKATEEESVRIRNIAKNLNQKAREQKALIDEKTKEIERLAAENEKLSNIKVSNAKILEEHQELKTTVDKLKREAASHKTQLDGANEQNNRLRETLRKFQSTIRELKDSEKKLSDQLAALKSSSADHEVSTEALKPSSNPDSEKHAEVLEERLPMIPEDGFTFGPSDGTRETQQLVESKKRSPLRAEAEVYTPGKNTSELKPQVLSTTGDVPSKNKSSEATTRDAVPDSALAGSEAEIPKPTRRMSGEKKELSMKEKLIEKKRKLEEAKLRKRKLEIEASQNAQSDPSNDHEKRAKTGDAPGSSLDSSNAELRKTEPDKKSLVLDAQEQGEDDDVTKKVDVEQSEPMSDSADASKMDLLVAPPASTNIPAFGSGGSLSFNTVTTPIFSSSTATAPSVGGKQEGEQDEAPTFANPVFGGGSSTSFLDMKPPGSSSSVSFSFGTSSFKLPTPAQPGPAPATSPFNAFGSGTNPFGSFGSSNVPISQPLFDSQVNEKKDETNNEQE